MNRPKYKATGCARFFIALLIILPLAYFGAKLLRGGEGIPAVESLLDSIVRLFKSEDQIDASPVGRQDQMADEIDLQQVIDDQRLEIDRLTEELRACQERSH